MSRWRPRLAQSVHCSGPVCHALVLCCLTFGVVLPLCCHRLVYSYYFIKPLFLDSMSDAALQDSLRRGQDALHFWKTTERPDVHELSQEAGLTVTVVTARRSQAQEFHYLLQVMKRLHELLRGCEGKPRCANVLICDVEHGTQQNEDVALVEKHFKVIRRTSKDLDVNLDSVNIFEREKRDYVFCLRKGLELTGANNVVVLEDDALPRLDFFNVLYNLLSRSFIKETLYVKLYHPERLQRYWNPEPYRILEWVGLGSVLATLLLLALPHCKGPVSVSVSRASLLFFTLYFMAVVELFGRHYLLEARRVSPQLYAVSPATECCTPAMLFPGNSSARVANYLDAAFCSKGNAKDTVLYRSVRTEPGERAHSLEPNLIRHIGAYSSVRPNPARPKLL